MRHADSLEPCLWRQKQVKILSSLDLDKVFFVPKPNQTMSRLLQQHSTVKFHLMTHREIYKYIII